MLTFEPADAGPRDPVEVILKLAPRD